LALEHYGASLEQATLEWLAQEVVYLHHGVDLLHEKDVGLLYG
jgi:hypothetical protein